MIRTITTRLPKRVLRQSVRYEAGPYLARSRTYSASNPVDHEPPKFSKDKSTDLRDEASPKAAAEKEKKKHASKQKSTADADEELKRRLEEMSGEGGASGIEFENGKPASMKRSVRENMFRYI